MDSNYWLRRGMSRRRALRVGGAAGIGGAALGVFGCGDDDDKNKKTATASAAATQGSGTAAASASASASAASTKVDRSKLSDDEFIKSLPDNFPKDWKDADLKTGGTAVRIVNRQAQWDFMSTRAAPAFEWTMPAYSKLIRYSNEAGLKSVYAPTVEGDLATKWEKPDPQTLVLTLAPNIKWQNKAPVNGRAFTVNDIKTSFDRGKSFTASAMKTYYAMYTTIEDIGNNQVRIKLDKPNPIAELPLTLCQFAIMPPEISKDADTVNTNIAGTGPFILKDFTPNVVGNFVKNPDYFKKDSSGRQRPYMDGMRLETVLDATTVAAKFQSGDADFSYAEAIFFTGGYDGLRELSKRLPNVPIQHYAGANVVWTVMGHYSKPPWNDPRVRKGLNLLVPRDKIIASSPYHKGAGFVEPYFAWSFIMDKPPTTKDLGPNYAYDPKAGKALLDAAGVTNQTFELQYFDNPSATEFLTIFQQEAAQVGMKLNLVKNEMAQHFVVTGSKSWKDLVMGARGIEFLDPSATGGFFNTGNALNEMGVSDPTFDGLFAQLATATGEERKKVARAMWDRQIDQVYEVPGTGRYTVEVIKPRLKNWTNQQWSAAAFGQGNVDQVWIDPNAPKPS